jgi:glycosyltransferase involved in cell wall biosynthesis
VIVHQWVPSAHAGDAVGDQTLVLRTLLRALGHTSDIFAINIDPALEDEVRPWTGADARAADVTIFHFASPSEMSAAFGTLSRGRVLQYHNVTPAPFLAPFDQDLARLAARARAELGALASRTDLAVAPSDYSRRELQALGFTRTAVLPLIVDPTRLRQAERVPALEWILQDGLTNILFVGRIAPNKKIEDHIRLAEQYKRYVDAEYRFIFVGRTDAVPAYFEMIQGLISTYRMLPERFLFPGAVPETELAAYYRNAHAYVSLSEHEGFCVPLVEAMAMDVPVLAYAAAAVPETLGGEGVSFAPKDLEYAAELLGALIYDEPFRAGVIDGQRRRVRDFGRLAVEPALRQLLETVAS